VVETRRGESEVERSFRAAAAGRCSRYWEPGELATPGPQQQVPTTPLTAMLRRMNSLEVTDTPPSPCSQRQHGSGAVRECVDGGVVWAVLGSNIADGSASARIGVQGGAKQFGISETT
jgi:hypothetical protein